MIALKFRNLVLKVGKGRLINLSFNFPTVWLPEDFHPGVVLNGSVTDIAGHLLCNEVSLLGFLSVIWSLCN